MIRTPSWVSRRPARVMRRARTGSGSEGEWATAKRNCTAVDTLLTFCPPGPEARTNASWISRSSSSIWALTRIMAGVCRSPLHHMHIVQCAPQEALADGLEAQRNVGDIEIVTRLDMAGVGKMLLRQDSRDLFGHGFGRIDQRDLIANHLAQQRFQQRVMRAAKHQGVDMLGHQRFQVILGGEPGDFVVEPAYLHQRPEQCAGL